MGLIGKTDAVPYNPDNYVLPSQVSGWFSAFQADGTLGDWRELGNIMEISAELTEEYLDHESFRKGIQTIDRQLINKVTGSIKLTMDELVGRNLEIIMKSKDIDAVSDERVYEQVTLQFGDAGTAIDLDDATRDFNDTLDYQDVVVTEVRARDGTAKTFEYAINSPDKTYAFIVDNSGTPSDAPTIEINATYSDGGEEAADLEGGIFVVTYYVERGGTRYSLQDGITLEGSLRLQMLSRNGPQGIFVFNRVVAKIAGAIAISPTEWFKVPMDFTVLTSADGTRGYYTQLTYHPSFTV